MFLGLTNGATLRKRALLKELPPVPVTGWKAPTFFPDLRDAQLVAVDTETKELDFDHGPGWGRKAGHIVGISVAALARDGVSTWKGYFPIRHEAEPWDNMEVQPVLRWAKDMLEAPTNKTGANLLYDVGWLGEEGINVGGRLYDVQFAEALLDESAHTRLDVLAHKYLRSNKSSAEMYYWQSKAFGGAANGNQRANIYRTPPSLVGYYAEDDAALPLGILPMQWAKLHAEDLLPLYEMECRLIRLLIKMRRQGVAIDLPYAEQLYTQLGGDLKQLHEQFNYKYGRYTNYNASADLAKTFDSIGVKYPKTETGNASFVKDWLTGLEHPIGKEIIALRELEKLKNTFVRGYLLESNVEGRLHCQFHPLRKSKGEGGKDTNGAKTGRLSSSDPNLQNIPIRSKTGKKIRRAFVKFRGHRQWRKYDYSQIEYRFLAHFAVDNGDGSADALRANYLNDPNCDYHDIVYYRACPFMGWDATDDALKKDKRRPIKNTNFGLLYGQGQGKLGRTMNFTPEQARDFFTAYHSAAPYVKPTMEMCGKEVDDYGFVRTILGRRTRFNLWTPFNWQGEDATPLAYEAALARYGSNIERAYRYRAVNYKFQGSAADMMKVALDKCDQAGVFDVIGVPLLTVHDELDFSDPDDTPIVNEAFDYMQHIMETAIPLRVPVRADPDTGPNWGELGD